MSPEINGNGNPPSVTKRKKNREKKTASKINSFDLNMPQSNYFQNNSNNVHNPSIPDISAYYSFLNYSTPTEPMSLPIYPTNFSNYPYPNTNYSYMGATKPSMIHNNIPAFNGDTSEYLSLPVVNLDQNDDESSKRRYSDPGLPNDSDSSTNSTIEGKTIQKLTQQVNILKESNRKLTRELMDLRVEVNILKQQQGLRHFDREYEPGMVSDLIREVRDAARVREDALLARVRHMIEEKEVNLGHLQLVSEKNRNNDRISKLEEQLKNLSVNQSRSDDSMFQSPSADEGNTSARQVIELEREALDLRRELQDTRAKKDEADKKLHQLDKKLANILRRNEMLNSETSEDGKTTSTDTQSITTTISSVTHHLPSPRVTLSGPVTDL